MKHILWALIVMLLFSLPVFAERAGGWINQDTVWTQENSPYVVYSFLYIATGVTLTIEPGVQVLVSGASISEDWWDFFWTGSGSNPVEPIAKMIIVHGKIVAHGSETNPILFDTWQSDQMFRWEGIHFTENAPKSEFEFCQFKRTYMGFVNPNDANSWGALRLGNGKIHLRYCTFETNVIGIACGNLQEDTVIYGCKFISLNLSGFFYDSSFISIGSYLEATPMLTIARCEFSGIATDISGGGVHVMLLFNKYINFRDVGSKDEFIRDTGNYSMYGNDSDNSQTKFFCWSYTETDTVYCRRNYIYKPNLDSGYAVIQSASTGYSVLSDNYGYGHVKFYNVSRGSDVYNNILETIGYYAFAVEIWGGTHTVFNQPRIYNNVFRHFPPEGSPGGGAVYCRDVSPLIYNNDFINYQTIMVGGYTSPCFYNNIMDGQSNTSSADFVEGHPLVFMNNCVEIPVPALYDGGGNIVTDPQYADSLGGDFSLGQGSPCIDAGLVIADLPAFDINYHKRISSSYPGGPRAVDMGAYEYNSVYIGGISGYVYDSQSLEPVDCAKIEIMGKLPEFSDSLGCFPFPCGAGTRTVKVSRWDYQDLIISNVAVVEGEDTILNIPLVRNNVSSDDNALPPLQGDIGLRNYPNPFNPETTISFIAPHSGNLTLSVYNVKGQKVRTLLDGFAAEGYHNITWNGKDETGLGVGSGVYFIRIEQGGKSHLRKMLMLK